MKKLATYLIPTTDETLGCNIQNHRPIYSLTDSLGTELGFRTIEEAVRFALPDHSPAALMQAAALALASLADSLNAAALSAPSNPTT